MFPMGRGELGDTSMDSNEIYYLPGMGGRIDAGLGRELLRRGYALSGRETIGEFKKLRFGEQVDAVKKDLSELFWRPEARVIANSFGGYLFLHAQIGLEPFPGRVLLLSPIIGAMDQSANGVRFYPPRADVLRQIAQVGGFPKLSNIEVHVGEEDWQAGPHALVEFCEAVGIELHVVPRRGHMLGSDYVGPLLETWLTSK
jgi:hypothetical protein